MKNLQLPSTLPCLGLDELKKLTQQLSVLATDILCCFDLAHPQFERSPLLPLCEFIHGREVSRLLLLNTDSDCSNQRSRLFSGNWTPKTPSGNRELSVAKMRKTRAMILFKGNNGEMVALMDDPKNEQIFCLWSWGDPKRIVRQLSDLCEQLWNDPSLELSSVDLENPQSLIKCADIVQEEPVLYQVTTAKFSIPEGFVLRDYQKEAIRAWLTAGGTGILAMATGAGKTLTALTLACKVAEKNRPLVLLVVCPYLNLASQWIRDMERFGLQPIPCFYGRSRWEHRLQEAYQRILTGLDFCISIVVSNATFLSETFQNALRVHGVPHLLIADEVHNLGAQNLKESLPTGIHLRLGLSATPERHGDEPGTQALIDYFGEIVYKFDIKRAIAEGVLVPYHYHPILVDLTDEEAERYTEISRQIARAWGKAENDNEGMERLRMLLIRRARLLASAQNKLPTLSALLESRELPIEKAIVYCGDGQVDSPTDSESERQIQAVIRLLGDKHGIKVRQFTCEEPSEEREEILQKLKAGALDAVVAIRCLDEGIDIPDIRLGFLLASSTNPRQFIQRRGRLLRRAPGKKRAEIYDFIVQPPDFGGESDPGAFNLERRLFRRELERVLEFCGSAENGPAALLTLQNLRLQYNLLAQ